MPRDGRLPFLAYTQCGVYSQGVWAVNAIGANAAPPNLCGNAAKKPELLTMRRKFLAQDRLCLRRLGESLAPVAPRPASQEAPHSIIVQPGSGLMAALKQAEAALVVTLMRRPGVGISINTQTTIDALDIFLSEFVLLAPPRPEKTLVATSKLDPDKKPIEVYEERPNPLVQYRRFDAFVFGGSRTRSLMEAIAAKAKEYDIHAWTLHSPCTPLVYAAVAAW